MRVVFSLDSWERAGSSKRRQDSPASQLRGNAGRPRGSNTGRVDKSSFLIEKGLDWRVYIPSFAMSPNDGRTG